MAIYSPAVTCYEEYNTVRESWNLDSVTAEVTLRCAWANRHLLIADLIGNQRSWPHGGFASPPKASSASLVAWDTAYTSVGQSITYVDALVKVRYTHDAEDLISESIEPTADFITLDWKRFRWGAANGDALTEAEAPGKLRRGLSLVRTLYKVAPPLSTKLLTEIGKCNDAQYVSALLGLTFDEETLLFCPPHLTRTIRTDGSDGFNLTMKFMYKPEGWNKFWRAKNQAYEEIFNVAGGPAYKNHPLGDFSDFLF